MFGGAIEQKTSESPDRTGGAEDNEELQRSGGLSYPPKGVSRGGAEGGLRVWVSGRWWMISLSLSV